MYIAPNSVLRVLHNCPLDTSFEHTIYFATRAAQTSYFQGLTKYTYNSLTYQRANRGAIRIQQKADDLYDCNYLMFQNTNYGSKWFYAYIQSIEYINDVTSEIRYVIDVMQTWLPGLDYTLDACFVDREHSDTDVIGANTVPENIETGSDFVINYEYSPLPQYGGGDVMFLCTFNDDEDFTDFTGVNSVYAGTFSGLNCIRKWSQSTDPNKDAQKWLEKVIDATKLDGIIAAFAIPLCIAPDDEYVHLESFQVNKDLNSINNYVPRNKKLFTYPYTMLRVESESNCGDFRYEYFSGNKCDFYVFNCIQPSPSISIVPYNYLSEVAVGKFDHRITSSNFPSIAFNADVWKVYLAQNKSSQAVKQISTVYGAGVGMLTSVNNFANADSAYTMGNERDYKSAMSGIGAGAALGMAIGGPAGLVAGLTTSLISTGLEVAKGVARIEDMRRLPPQANGTQSGNTDWFIYTNNRPIRFYNYTIRAEYARIVDEYFDIYGYATKRVKVPNINVRKHWTYTKTIGCNVHGSIPCDDLKEICAIFDNGITFWKSGSEVGHYLDYRADNTPVVTEEGE